MEDALIQSPRSCIDRRNSYDELQTVVGYHRVFHREFIMRQVFRVQHEVLVLHEVQIDGRIGTSQNLDTQRIGSLRTHQSSALLYRDTPQINLVLIGRLIEIGHGLGNVDIAAALLHAFTIKAFHHFRMLRIVVRNLVQSLIEDTLGITRPHHDIIENHRTGLHLDDKISLMEFRYFIMKRLIADVRQIKGFHLAHGLDGEESVFIGYGGNPLATHVHIDVRQLLATLVGHHAAHGIPFICLLNIPSSRCHREKHQQQQNTVSLKNLLHSHNW